MEFFHPHLSTQNLLQILAQSALSIIGAMAKRRSTDLSYFPFFAGIYSFIAPVIAET